MLRTIKVLLVLAVGIWGLIGALGNLLNWNGVVAKVAETTAMSGWKTDLIGWREVSNPVLVHLGAAMIPAAKLTFGLLCLMGAWRMWRARSAGGIAFEQAKSLALAGCGVALLMLFVGWIVIADTWFEAWRSGGPMQGALGTAFRYAGFAGLIALFVGARDDIAEA